MRLRLEGRTPAFCYRIAGQSLWVDRRIDELAPFEGLPPAPSLRNAGALQEPASSAVLSSASHGGEPRLLFDGRAWVGGLERRIVARFGTAGYGLEIEDVGKFLVSLDGRRIDFEPCASTPSERALVSTALGPPLTLALAARGIWILHASAVMSDRGAVLFLGESGVGKSTLASYLDSSPALGGSLRLLADDVVPTAGSWALPHFPQLKLSAAQQPATRFADRAPLAAIYLLNPTRPESAPVEMEPLERAAAVLALVRHTVASRLFSRTLLAAHLDHCARLADSIGVFRLSYPKNRRSLGRLAHLACTEHSLPAQAHRMTGALRRGLRISAR